MNRRRSSTTPRADRVPPETKELLVRAVVVGLIAAAGLAVAFVLAATPASAQDQPGIDLTIEVVSGEPGLVLEAEDVVSGQVEQFVDGGSAFFAVPAGTSGVSLLLDGAGFNRDLFRFLGLECTNGDTFVVVEELVTAPVPGMLSSLVIEGVGLQGVEECVLQIDRGVDATLTIQLETTNGDTTSLFEVHNVWFPETLQVAGGTSAKFRADRVAWFGINITPPDDTWARDSTTCTDQNIVNNQGMIMPLDGITADVTCTVVFGPAGGLLTITNTTSSASAALTAVNTTTGERYDLNSGESESIAVDVGLSLHFYPRAGWILDELSCDVPVDFGGIVSPKFGSMNGIRPLVSGRTCSVALTPVAAAPVVTDPATEVVEAVSCLVGNGRLDYNIVNRGETAAVYRIQIGALAPREFSVAPGTWWRSPVTGRRDGPIDVRIFKDGALIVDHIAYVVCDDPFAPEPETPEAQVVVHCVGGNGLVLVQFVNPTDGLRSYVVDVGGIRRSQSAQARGAAVRGISGRPDGVYDVRAFVGAAQVLSTTATVACD